VAKKQKSKKQNTAPSAAEPLSAANPRSTLMPPTARTDPYGQMNFEVVIDAISPDGKSARGGFSEVLGLGMSIDVIEYRNGGDAGAVRKMPGLTRFSNITLKRGIIGDTALFNWIQSVSRGQPTRSNVSIVLLDETRSPVMRWKILRAWPCKWEGPVLNGKGNEVAIESIELCHEGIEIDD